VTATGGSAGEIHLQAGIMMAIRQYYRVTRDANWLRVTAWPMITNFVRYFESR
jgi:trehalose/maltose hydrolase-like predicted phosphorylase